MTHKQTQLGARESLRKLITEDNPQLCVKLDYKQIGNGIVSGWANDFATVWLSDDPKVAYEFAWSTVERAVTNGVPLMV